MYYQKFFYTFKDINNKAFRVEIHQEAEAPFVPVELRAGPSPFILDYPERNKLKPVWASGCTFQLWSETNMQHIGLASADMFEYLIKLIEIVQITPIVTEERVRWTGYLDSETYEEPFNEIDNYPVTFRATDGFALLARIAYTSEGDRYDTTGTKWTTLYNLLFKIKLPFNKLYVGLSTSLPGTVIAADKTLFHYLFTNPDNWYNEDGDPETCLTVLEEILKPYGAFIFVNEADVVITDLNFIKGGAGTNRTFKVYDVQDSLTFLYEDTFSIVIGDLSEIGFMDDNQTFQIMAGYNRQVVSFNAYKLISLLNYKGSEDSFTEQDLPISEGDASYGYTYTTFHASEFWEEHNGSNFIFIIGTGSKNKNKILSGLRLQEKLDGFDTSLSHLSFVSNVSLPYVIPNGGYKLKLTASLFPKTWEHFGKIPTEISAKDAIASIAIHMDIIIDNEVGTKKQYVHSYPEGLFNDTGAWVTLDTITPPDSVFIFAKPKGQATFNTPGGWQTKVIYDAMNDQDCDLKSFTLGASVEDEDGNYSAEALSNDIIIPLPANCSGRIVVKIYDYIITFKDGATATNTGFYWNLVFKELGITVIDSNNNEVKKLDVEYVGDSLNSPLNPKFKNEAPEVTLYCGSNASKYPSDCANILKLNAGGYYEPVQQFTRQGVTGQIESLLLRSIISNHYRQFIQLDLTANRLTTLIGYLTYSNYLAGKCFLPVKLSRNYAEGTDELTLQEFSEDAVTVTTF